RPHYFVIESGNLWGSCQPLDGSRFGMGERQSARNGEDHVSVCNGRDGRREEGERETDFSSSGEIGQGAVHESLLPADHRDNYGAILRILRGEILPGAIG